MTNKLKDYLKNEKVLNWIDDYQFEYIYELANLKLTEKEIRDMTLFFVGEIGINPLQYMVEIPTSYFAEINTPKIIIPEGIQSIDENAFTNSNIASLYLPKSLKSFSDDSFNDCNVAVVCLPSTIADYINNVDIDAYSGAYNGAFKLGDSSGNIIKGLVIPAGLTAVSYPSHFQDCISIERIKFEEGVEEIGRYTFSGCHSLHEIELPLSMVGIGKEAFAYCVNLGVIRYKGTFEEFNKITFEKDWLTNGDGTVHTYKLICTDGTYIIDVTGDE